ncbi:MAG: fused MFS/spermidine synthase, partial [Deltaproteobacteria bacterium]
MVEERGRAVIAFLVMGLGALLAQILLLRELMVVFSGNELSTGVMLSAWLLWTAVGSAVLGVISDRIEGKASFFALFQLILAFLLPASFLLARYLRPFMGVPVGEIASLPQMVIGIFLLLIPFCLFSGFLFSLGCSLLGEILGKEARSVGVVYVYEALGAGIGGVAFSYLLIHFLNPWQVVLLTAALLSLSSFLLCRRLRPLAILWICLLLGTLAFYGGKLNLISKAWGWKGYEVIATKDTIYGNITVISDGPQMNFFENGVWNFTYPDPMTAEEAVHFALLEHPGPTEVLLVGGGVGGLVEEVLKHPSIRRLDYVELDPQLIKTGRRHLPPEATSSLDDPRVQIIYTDGRRFVQRGKERYDAIILNLPDPTTAQLNRCYTEEFFAEVKRAIHKEGVFYLSVSSSENVIGHTLAQFLSSIYWTMKQIFPEVVVLPGPAARFLGARTEGILVTDPRILVQRAHLRELRLRYVREYYILFNLSPERVHYLQSVLERGRAAGINKDLHPICYFYDIVLWSAQYTPLLKKWFLWMLGMRVEWLLYLFAVITVILLWRGRRSSSSAPLLWAVAITGFSEIALEVILILAFQIIYGYLYYKIGIIITAYMIGLALGGWMITAVLRKVKKPLRSLLMVQTGVVLYALGVLLLIMGLHRGVFPPSLSPLMETIFPFLTLLAGFLGGVHFPLANKVYLGERTEIGRIGGLINGVDLVGSAAGALVISVILLPILGIS